MMLWIILALMTGAAVMAVLWPLSLHAKRGAAPDADTCFYRDQIAEIDRDEARGLISATEAEAAKTEAGRRLLRTAEFIGADAALGEPALRRRRAASALALSTVPLLALALYGAFGSPQLPAQPLAARFETGSDRLDMAAATAKVEAHLAQHPDDGRGWEVIAPVYLRSGRLEDAVKAYAATVRLLGDTGPRLSSYGEAMVTANEGIVSAAARGVFERALVLEPQNAKAHFYLARAAEQDGDRDKARARYEGVLTTAPPGAPWVPLVKERLARLEDAEAASTVPALAPELRVTAIRGMVEGLAARLEAEGGTPAEWQRLVRSYTVLGEPHKAEAALMKAREALAQDQTAMVMIDAMARDLGLGANERTP